jgi:hypothetical protein
MACHILAKILVVDLGAHNDSKWVEKKRLRVKGQVGFKRNHCTNDHIFTLSSIIDESKESKRKAYCCFMKFCKALGIVLQALVTYRIKYLFLLPLVVLLVMTL